MKRNFLQAFAAWAPLVLHPVKDDATHQLLRGAVNERDPVVRERALESLGLIRSPADVGIVGPLLDAPFEPTRQQAARTAESLGMPLRAKEISNAATTRRRPAEPPAPPANALRGTNTLAIARALARLDAAQARAEAGVILRLIESPEIILQEEAIHAARRAELAEAVPLLLRKLDDPDERLRAAPIDALAALVAKSDRAAILTALVRRLETDDSSRIRTAAARTVAAMHDDAALAELRRLLRHDRGVTRQAAALALGAWGDAALARDLEPLLADTADLVARTAAESLGALKNPQSKAPLLAQLMRRTPFVQEKIAWALGELRAAEAIDAFTQLLATDRETLKVELVTALGKMPDKRALPPLRTVLASISYMNPMPKPRVAALDALRDLGDKASLPRALQLVTAQVVPPAPGGGPTYDDDIVRIAGLRFLAALGDKSTGAALITAFKHTPPRDIRPEVAAALTTLTGQRYDPAPDQDFRAHSIESLDSVPYLPPPANGVLTGVNGSR